MKIFGIASCHKFTDSEHDRYLKLFGDCNYTHLNEQCILGEQQRSPHPTEKPANLVCSDGIIFRSNDSYNNALTINSHGIPALNEQEGIFSFAYWEQQERVLTIGTDRYGLRPLYYLQEGENFYFSSDLNWLVQSCSGLLAIDWETVGQHLSFRHGFGDNTLFKEIKRTPQGKLVQFISNENRIRFITFFNYLDLSPDSRLSADQAVDEGPSRLMTAIQRYSAADSKVHVLLSGGYDSRVLVYGLYQLGKHIHTYTTHKDYSYLTDIIAAKEIAALLRTQHYNIPLPADYVRRYHQLQCILLNFETSYHTWMLAIENKLSVSNRPNYDGLGGDACLGASEVTSKTWHLWQQRDLNAVVESHFKWYKTSLAQLVNQQWRSFFEASAKKKLMAEIKEVFPHPNGLIYLGLKNFSRRAIGLAPYMLLINKIESYCPFFEHELFDWAMRIPVEHKINKSIYQKIVNQFTGPLKHIPTTHDKSNNNPYFKQTNYYWKNSVNLNYLAEQIKQLKQFFSDLLHPDLFEKIKAKNVSGSEKPALFGLADFAFWLKTYSDKINLKDLKL